MFNECYFYFSETLVVFAYYYYLKNPSNIKICFFKADYCFKCKKIELGRL